MNATYRTVWNESLGAWAAAAEKTKARGKRASAVAAAALMVAGLQGAAWAGTSIGTTYVTNAQGSVCSAVGSPAAGSAAWTCQVPNGSGGFAIISGVTTTAGGGPDLTSLSALVTANLGTDATLIGNADTKAQGTDSIAIGNAAQATATHGVALGSGSTAEALNSVAVGRNAQVLGTVSENTIAVGSTNTLTNSKNSLTVGSSNTTTDSEIVGIIGGQNTATQSQLSSMIGVKNELATSGGVSVIGIQNKVTGSTKANVIGLNNTVTGMLTGLDTSTSEQNTVIGEGNTLTDGKQNFVAGFGNILGGGLGNTQVIGSDVTVGAGVQNGVALGSGSTLLQSGSVALGSGSVASTGANEAGYAPAGASMAQHDAIAATTSTLAAASVGDAANGKFRQITGVAAGTLDSDAVNVSQLKAVNSAVAAGQTHFYSVNSADTAAGNYSNNGATGADALAAGVDAQAFGDRSIAIGKSATAGTLGAPEVTSMIAIGELATAIGSTAIAVGRNALAVGEQAISIGIQAGLNSENSDYTTFVGASAGTYSNGDRNTAVSYAAGQYVIGSRNTAIGIAAGQVARGDRNFAGGASAGRFITGDANVAVGASAGSGVNGAQLVVSDTASLGARSKTTQSGGVALGADSVASTAASTAGGPTMVYTPFGANAGQVAAINATKSTLAAVSVGNVSDPNPANHQFRQITGVAAGTLDSDAVNVSQLKAVNSAVAAGQAHFYSVNSNDTAAGNYNNDGATGTNALAAGVGASATEAGSVALGEGAKASNANSVALGSNAITGDFDVVNTATISTPAGSYSYGGFAGNTNVVGVVSVGGANSATRQITNVAPGAITATSTDAINGSQLYAVAKGLNERIDTVSIGGGTPGPAGPQGPQGEPGADAVPPEAGTGTAGTVTYSINPDGTVNYDVVNLNPTGSGPTTITNVANGVNGSDAVNVNQLNSVTNKWVAGNPTAYAAPQATGEGATAVGSGAMATGKNSVALGDGSFDDGRDNVVSVGSADAERQVVHVAPGTSGTDAVNVNQLNAASEAANAYTDERVNNLANRVEANRRDANAGTAAAIAMAAMPQAYLPGKSMLAAGVGNYQGETSVAIGMSKLSDNGRWVFKVGGTVNSRGKAGVGAGAGFHF